MSLRKLLKLKVEFDIFDLKIHLSSFDINDLDLQTQQLHDDLLSFKLEMKREVE